MKCTISRITGVSLPASRMSPNWWKPSFLRRLWCSAWSPTRATSWHIFEVGLRVNTNIYVEIMVQIVLPWITCIAGGRPWSGSRTLPTVMCSTGSWSRSRSTAATSSPRSNSLLAAPDLNPMDCFYFRLPRGTYQYTPPPPTLKPVWLHPSRSASRPSPGTWRSRPSTSSKSVKSP